MVSELGPSQLRLLPLGGLGEIGMNCLALEQSDGALVVDCGTAFPHDDLGIDVIHPDFTWLVENAERVHGVVVTHGHEDHIGGLPYLLDQIDVPVWGPPHALGLVHRRLEEHEFRPSDVRLRELAAGQVIHVGPFEVESIRVAHSIVEASALRIQTAAGTVVHTGDFNLDPDPPDGEPTDLARLQALGDAGVDLLLSDSTNIDVAERPGSERQVGQALERLIRRAEGRVVVAMFASNIQRLRMLGEIAVRTHRKLCVLGRSLGTQREIATAIGRLDWPSNLVVAPEEASAIPRRKLLVLAGGSQAEPASAMAKLATGKHPLLALDVGDTVLLSSRIIPGNDRPVLSMVDDLLRRGAIVHTRHGDPDIHTSGHAGRSEQARMLALVRPRAFVPVHGTFHHLLRHAELARESAVGDVLVLENGQAARFDAAGLARDGGFRHGKVAVAQGGEPLPDDVLRRRTELARSGVVTVSVLLGRRGEPVQPPTVTARGVPAFDDDDAALGAVSREVATALARSHGRGRADPEDEVRRVVRRRVGEISGIRPVVEVHLVRMEG